MQKEVDTSDFAEKTDLAKLKSDNLRYSSIKKCAKWFKQYKK